MGLCFLFYLKLERYYEVNRVFCPGGPALNSTNRTFSTTSLQDACSTPVGEKERNYDHSKLFVWGTPKYALFVIQGFTLLQSFYMSFYTLVFAHRINVYCNPALLFHILMLIPPILVMFVFLPLLLTTYSLLSHVEDFTHQENCEYVLRRMFLLEHAPNKDFDEEPGNDDFTTTNIYARLGPSPVGLGSSNHPLHASFAHAHTRTRTHPVHNGNEHVHDNYSLLHDPH